MNYLGVVMAVAGLLTIVPALEDVGIGFGLGLIVWLGWVGAILLRDSSIKSLIEVTPSTILRDNRAYSNGLIGFEIRSSTNSVPV
jgi:hypothetical protein